MTLQRLRQDLGTGLGLRSVHYAHILAESPKVDFFEILSENYMHTGGRPLHILDQVAERYPIVMHGVSMNIGTTDPLDRDYLRQLLALQQRCGARWISDHLCFTGVSGTNTHDLLPMPTTHEALRHVSKRVHQVQDILGQPLILENPSTYLEYTVTELSEAEFFTALCRETGCGMLLDVNNVFVCASNHDQDAEAYLRALPWDHVVYFHLAGHTVYPTHRLDTHDHPVCDEVWQLYRLAWQLSGGRSTLLEWDGNIPDFATTHAEALKSKRYRARANAPARRRVGAAG
jgi:uncharacterized protein (UPF0276 family)